jgi:hypothetical protein
MSSTRLRLLALWMPVALSASCVSPAWISPGTQVYHDRDELTGRDTTTFGFKYFRSFHAEGNGTMTFVEGAAQARLDLKFQGDLSYATCHDVEMAVDGAPVQLGGVKYAPRISGSTPVEEIEVAIPGETLRAFERATRVAIRICKDEPDVLSGVERDGLKAFAQEVLAKIPAGSPATGPIVPR